MMIVDAFKYGISNYVNFQGRTPRDLFWYYVLAVIILSVIASIIDNAIIGSPLLGGLLSLALLLPGLGMTIRRLHDIGKSGWWILISLVPLVGSLFLIYLLAQPSSPEGAQFE